MRYSFAWPRWKTCWRLVAERLPDGDESHSTRSGTTLNRRARRDRGGDRREHRFPPRTSASSAVTAFARLEGPQGRPDRRARDNRRGRWRVASRSPDSGDRSRHESTHDAHRPPPTRPCGGPPPSPDRDGCRPPNAVPPRSSGATSRSSAPNMGFRTFARRHCAPVGTRSRGCSSRTTARGRR
jgi:hypothetical protein